MLEQVQADFDSRYDEEIQSDPLFCVACGKKFAKQTVFDAHLAGKKHIKAIEALQTGKLDMSQRDDEKRVALQEAQIQAIVSALPGRRQATLVNVERKQARTAEELMDDEDDAAADAAADAAGESSDEDDTEKPIYNPKKLPLGWDGKPIPYWLFKLHGLNKEFKCEICGDVSYRGPKVFHQHFQVRKHLHRVSSWRCLCGFCSRSGSMRRACAF